MSDQKHDNTMHIVSAGRKVQVVDAESGIILRTLDNRAQAEGWRAEAGRPSASKR